MPHKVDPETVASDSFMVNLQSVLYKLADPFIDATYSKVSPPQLGVLFFLLMMHNRLKMDRVDSLFYIHSDRIDLSDETRIKSTSEEANEWTRTNQDPRGRTALSYTARLTSFFESFGA